MAVRQQYTCNDYSGSNVSDQGWGDKKLCFYYTYLDLRKFLWSALWTRDCTSIGPGLCASIAMRVSDFNGAVTKNVEICICRQWFSQIDGFFFILHGYSKTKYLNKIRKRFSERRGPGVDNDNGNWYMLGRAFLCRTGHVCVEPCIFVSNRAIFVSNRAFWSRTNVKILHMMFYNFQ